MGVNAAKCNLRQKFKRRPNIEMNMIAGGRKTIEKYQLP